MAGGVDDDRPQAAESPGGRRARELRERAEKAAEAPDAVPAELRPPVIITDYSQLMDGGSVRIMLQDKHGRKACLEWNHAINGRHKGKILGYQPRESAWVPVASEILQRVQGWVEEAVLRGDFPKQHAADVAEIAKPESWRPDGRNP